jgi:exosortase
MGLGISIVSLLAYVVSYAGGIQLVPRLTVVSSLIALFLFNFGGSVFSVLSFPFFFLFFVVPVPVSIVKLASFSLQLLVTNVSARIIETLSIPVLRESNILHLADTSLEVAEACSGIRSLTSFFVIGVLFAYLMNASITRRPIMVLTAIPTPFLPNLLRVAGSRVLAFEFGGRLARRFLHSFSGMAILAVGFLVMGISFHLLEQTWNHTQV